MAEVKGTQEAVKFLNDGVGYAYTLHMKSLSDPNKELRIASGVIDHVILAEHGIFVYLKHRGTDQLQEERFTFERMDYFEIVNEHTMIVMYKDKSYFRVVIS